MGERERVRFCHLRAAAAATDCAPSALATKPYRLAPALLRAQVNLAFENTLRKMKVPMASLEKSGEAGPNPDDTRVFAIEACAVRVMKSRKTLTHQQ